jgi:hypothetical protein
MKIPFNKPYLSGKEIQYISEAIASRKISGDGGKRGRRFSAYLQTGQSLKGLGSKLSDRCADRFLSTAVAIWL